MSFLDVCEQYFLTRNFYEILNIKKDATEKEVRKAYHKLSLTCHPDRVVESKKAEATEKFKILGKVHVVLSDSEKRAEYDETGICSWEEDNEGNLDDRDWMEYWRVMFKKITIDDIKKYEQEYKGSAEELNDLIKAYKKSKGDMDKIYEYVPFLTLDEENRVRDRIQQLIDSKDLVAYDIFINEPDTKRDRRIRKLRKEEKQVSKEVEKRKQNEESGLDALAKNMLQRRQVSADNFLNALEKKYSSPNVKKKGGRGQKSKS